MAETKKANKIKREVPDEELLHAEEYGLPRVAKEVADFMELRFREINSADPRSQSKELCGGCVTSVLLMIVKLMGAKTNWGTITVSEQAATQLRHDAEHNALLALLTGRDPDEAILAEIERVAEEFKNGLPPEVVTRSRERRARAAA